MQASKTKKLHLFIMNCLVQKDYNLLEKSNKVVTAITKQGNPFSQTDMFNLVTFAVTPDGA